MENVNIHSIDLGSDDHLEPVYVFSKNKILSNIKAYQDEMRKQKFVSTLNYSVKANANPTILKMMKEQGCSLTLVSGLELQLALKVGFNAENLVFNGNGKQKWEIELAVNSGVLLNIDSVFNMEQTLQTCSRLNKKVRVLLRVNPNIEVDVHQHVSTGKTGSKFGLDTTEFQEVVSRLKEQKLIELVGLHCHLGSTIVKVSAIEESAKRIVEVFSYLRGTGFPLMKYINLGGGLGIAYKKHALGTMAYQNTNDEFKSVLENLLNEAPDDSTLLAMTKEFKEDKTSTEQFLELCREKVPNAWTALTKVYDAEIRMPSPTEMVNVISSHIGEDVHLILEPGRSLVGDAAVLVCSVLGCKSSGEKHYIVVNGAMTEVVRPSLYGSYHHIELAKDCHGEKMICDIVGPVCESGDFLGKSRLLNKPNEGDLLIVYDVGAYCGSMAMTYNMRLRAREIMVDGSEIKLIRRADTFDDLMAPYDFV